MPAVSEAYCIAAQTDDHSSKIWISAVQNVMNPSSNSAKLSEFFLSLSLFANHFRGKKLLTLLFVKACFLTIKMRNAKLEIFF